MPPIPQQVGMTPEQIAQFQADPNEWMRAVLGGQYLGSNPYIDQLIKTMEADAQRQFQESILPTRKSELNLSGAYGSALGAQAEARAAEDFARGLMGQTAGIRYQDYGAERENMMRALGLLSGETAASRQGLFGARDTDVGSATNIETANISAAAQRAAANAAAGASRYGADRSFAAARLGAQSDFWRDAFSRSGLMGGFTGGPSNAPQGGAGTQGAWGGPANRSLPYKPVGGDPWNQPGAWG